jgi:hypothetical protein
MEKYEEGIRRAAAHSIKDLNLGSKSFASTNDQQQQQLHRQNQINLTQQGSGANLAKMRSASCVNTPTWSNGGGNINQVRLEVLGKVVSHSGG